MVKVISLSNMAYSEIKAIKKEDESFSDVVLRLTSEKRKDSILNFFGIWSEDEAMKMKKMLLEDRKKFKTRGVEL